MSAFVQDAQYALRGFRRNPAFAAIAVFTLAIGIGANTSIFSVANALLLRQLPYAQPERLVYLSNDRANNGRAQSPRSWQRFELIRDHSHSFGNIGAFTSDVFNWNGHGEPEQLPAARV